MLANIQNIHLNTPVLPSPILSGKADSLGASESPWQGYNIETRISELEGQVQISNAGARMGEGQKLDTSLMMLAQDGVGKGERFQKQRPEQGDGDEES